MKKSNQKSLGEDPETPYASVHPDRKRFAFPDLGQATLIMCRRRI